MIDEIAETFPRLKERLDQDGTSMSGGEQQMLAIARAMMARAEDDPARRAVRRHHADPGRRDVRAVRADEATTGTTILLVEQNVERALSISDRAYIVDEGASSTRAPAPRCSRTAAIQERYCAV